MTEDELFVSAFWALDPKERATWFGDKLIPKSRLVLIFYFPSLRDI